MIRPARREEVEHFYGKTAFKTRLLAIEVGGRVLGVAGLVWIDGEALAVSWLTQEAKRHPREIVRCAHAVQAMAEEAGGLVYAEADHDEPTAPGLLEHLGFEQIGGGRYVYRPSQR